MKTNTEKKQMLNSEGQLVNSEPFRKLNEKEIKNVIQTEAKLSKYGA